jgi:hypothetical protein
MSGYATAAAASNDAARQGSLVRIHGLQSETSQQYNGRIGLVARIPHDGSGKVELNLIPDSKELKISQAKVCTIPQEAQAAIIDGIRRFQRAERDNDEHSLATVSLEIGGAYKAMEFFEEALKFYERPLGLGLMEANPIFKVGMLFLTTVVLPNWLQPVKARHLLADVYHLPSVASADTYA